MAHGPKGKARAEVGQGEDWEEDVEDLGDRGRSSRGSRREMPQAHLAVPSGKFIHHLCRLSEWPTHLKEPWDRSLRNPQLRMACPRARGKVQS